MRLKAIGDHVGQVNVKDFGAVGDWNGSSGTDDTTAFQAAFAALPATGGIVVAPRPTSRYRLTADIFSGAPRGTLFLWAGILDCAVKQNPLRDIIVRGIGRGDASNASVIRAANDFASSGDIVQLGDIANYSHGVLLEDCTIDANGYSHTRRGVYAPTIQELSGLRRVQMINVDAGVQVGVPGGSYPAYNWVAQDLEIYLHRNAAGVGVGAYNNGANAILRKATVNLNDAAGTPTGKAYKLSGVGIQAEGLHFEDLPTGLQIGETSGSTVTRNIHVRGLNCYAGNKAVSKVLWIPPDAGSGPYTDNFVVEAIRAGHGGTGSITDVVYHEQAGIALSGSNTPHILPYSEYKDIARYQSITDTGAAGGRCVIKTTAHERDLDITLPAGNSDALDLKGAETVRLTADAGGSTIRGIAGYVNGRRVRMYKAGGGTLTFAHATGAIAERQVYCKGGVNITLASDEVLETQYNYGPYRMWYTWKP